MKIKCFLLEQNSLTDADRSTLQQLAETGYKAYQEFKAHPEFVSYLEQMTTLPYYAKTNIGSRPAKRGKSDALVLKISEPSHLLGAGVNPNKMYLAFMGRYSFERIKIFQPI